MKQCPTHGPTRPDNNIGLLALLLVLGLFTCGLTWFFIPVVQLAGAVDPRCPQCGQRLERANR